MNFTSYVNGYGTRTGKRHEQLVDKIALAVQSETPFQDSIGRGDSSASSEFRWVEEALTLAQTNAQVDGADLADLAAGLRGNPALTSRTGYSQILSRGYIVADSYRNEDKASYRSKDELTEQEYNQMIAIKTDLENHLLSDQAAAAGAGSTVFDDPDGSGAVARQLTGAYAQVAGADANGQQSSTKYNTSTPNATGGTGRTIGEGSRRVIDTIAGVLYENGGLSYNMGNAHVSDANMIIMNPQNKIRFDRVLDAVNNTRRELGADGTRLGVRFTSYKSTFGDFEVFPDKYNPSDEVLIYNPQNWALQVHTNWYVKEIAPTGLAEKRQIAGEFGLMHRNQFVSGRLAEIATTGTAMSATEGDGAVI